MYDYWIEGINGRLDDPNLVLMQEQIDPFFYKDRLTMLKLIVSATGDEFFMPDDTYSFFDGPNRNISDFLPTLSIARSFQVFLHHILDFQ